MGNSFCEESLYETARCQKSVYEISTDSMGRGFKGECELLRAKFGVDISKRMVSMYVSDVHSTIVSDNGAMCVRYNVIMYVRDNSAMYVRYIGAMYARYNVTTYAIYKVMISHQSASPAACPMPTQGVSTRSRCSNSFLGHIRED